MAEAVALRAKRNIGSAKMELSADRLEYLVWKG